MANIKVKRLILKQNSLYHDILIKTYGRTEAEHLVAQANSYSALDTIYRAARRYKPKSNLVRIGRG